MSKAGRSSKVRTSELANTYPRRSLHIDTYDLASAVDRVKAIVAALKHYYGTENWLALRRKLQPGINRHQEEVNHPTQYQDE